MNSIAFVFPGQGSQYVGMGKHLFMSIPEAKQVFLEADDCLNNRLSTLCFEGPEEQLRMTMNTQPAILTVSIACYRAFAARSGIQPEYVAGHSLGEYSALVAANSLQFADAVRLVRQRGQFMQEAVPAGQGGMLAVVGVDRDTLEQLCAKVRSLGLVEVANINHLQQIVLAGEVKVFKHLESLLKDAGAKAVVSLPVSAPFHCSLMEPAGQRLAEVMAEIHFSNANPPVVVNVSAQPIVDAQQLQSGLIQQVSSAVLWDDTIRYMLAQGVDTFVEFGPGRVLSGLIKKIDRKTKVVNVQDEDSLNQALRLFGE